VQSHRPPVLPCVACVHTNTNTHVHAFKKTHRKRALHTMFELRRHSVHSELPCVACVHTNTHVHAFKRTHKKRALHTAFELRRHSVHSKLPCVACVHTNTHTYTHSRGHTKNVPCTPRLSSGATLFTLSYRLLSVSLQGYGPMQSTNAKMPLLHIAL